MTIRKTTFLLLLISLFFNLKILSLYAGTITVSKNISISATVGSNIVVTPESPGGGESISIPQTSVRFSGNAYPNATVTLLKNGEYATSVLADNKGLFDITLEEKYSSTTLYSLEATDITGEKSILINYPLVVTAGYLTYISGISFPPTIILDKIQANSFITVAGYASPKKELQIIIADQQNEKNEKTFTLTTPDDGHYDITLPLSGLPLGNYAASIKYGDSDKTSELIRFIIGDTDESSVDATLNIPGDFNSDGEINLSDFSIMAFWYKKPNPPSYVDINHDGIVDLTDFSILAYYWTN